MHTLLSGLNEQASRAWGDVLLDDAFSIKWQPASQFITEAEGAVDEPLHQRVWLYRAPWSWLADGDSADPMAELGLWQIQQRAVLKLHRNLRQRLILVNVDRTAAQSLVGYLGLLDYNKLPTIGNAATPLASTLSSLFEQLEPECWELYESLEASSWLPEGEPEFRSNRALSRSEGLGELLESIHAAKQMAATRQLLTERDQALQEFYQEREKSLSSLQAFKEENELLLDQLHQAQEELEKQHLNDVSLKNQLETLKQELAQTVTDRQQLTRELDSARKAAAKAEQARTKLSEEESRLRKEVTSAQTQVQSLSEENTQLFAQLHQVQEGLESYHLANRELLAAMGQSKHILHRARTLISRMAAHA